jgi:plastin-1
VDEKRVNRDRVKLNRFKKIENCNYAVQLCRELGFSLPGTGGIDIAGGVRKLVLGLVWQLMRLQVVKLLQAVGGGVTPKDSDIIEWANKTVAEAGNSGSISSFKDSSLATG